MEIFSKTEGSTFYFQSPLPYLCTCTITVDAKRKDLVEERKSERQMKIETSRKFLDCTIIAYSFLRNGYNVVLQTSWKNGNRIQKWHSHQRNSDERRVWLVHASCIGFSPRLCNQAWKWSLRFTSMTSFLRWSMQTKWYGKSRNGVSVDRLACNRQKETLFLMPYY